MRPSTASLPLTPRFSHAAWPHSHDPLIWYTHNPHDLRMAFNGAVKAVIWLRDENVHEERGRILLQQAQLFGHKPRNDLRAIARGDLAPYLPPIDSVVPRMGAAHQEYHVDNSYASKGPFVRFICGMKGAGPCFWAGALPEDMAAMIRNVRDKDGRYYQMPTTPPEGVIADICPQGAVIGFRSNGPGIDPQTLLVHGSPVTAKGERLAYLIHYVL